MLAIFRNKKRREVVRITLAVILTFGLSLSHACAALSFAPPSLCKSDKSINHHVDHVKKTFANCGPANLEGRVLLVQEAVELRDTKGSFLLLATIPPGQFGTPLTLANHRQAARIDLLHPPPDNSPPIFIKHCSLLR